MSFWEDLGFLDDDVQEIQHLIQQHLVMYHTATRRDLEYPRTVEEVARAVHGHEGLRELFLLTVCDVATTSPESWTSWKAKMLDELYLLVETWFNTGAVNIGNATRAVRMNVRNCLADQELHADTESFLDAMPERYVLANEPSHIAMHARLVLESRNKQCSVSVMSLAPPYAEFAVVANDCPGLLAMIAATIAAAHAEIVAAQIYSFEDADGVPRALDLFWLYAGDRVRTGRTLSTRIEKELSKLLSGEIQISELFGSGVTRSRGYVRPSPAVATRVSFDNRGATNDTIIEVTTRDRVGLLYELASALQQFGLVISLAKINTEGTQVADVFYVTEATGGKILNSSRLDELKQRILSAVELEVSSTKE